MQRPALAGEQVVGQRLAHERVAEAVGVGLGVDHDDVVRHRLAQPGHELVGREAGRALEQPVAHARARDGGEAQGGLGGRAQRLDAQHQRVGDVGRQALAGGGGGQLLGEERVALGAGEQLVDQARLGPAPEDPGELRDDLLAREALQGDALDDRGALGLGHQRPQRVAAVQLVGAVRGDEQHALVARVAHEEGQEVARRAVGPMDVLEDEHQRPRLGQASQEGEQELEHAPLRERALGAGLGCVELGEQRRQAGRGAAELAGVEAAQRADDRRIGQLAVAEVDAVAGEHARALRPRAGRELGDQPRLADARLARDQGDRRAPIGRAVERRGQARELALAPDELGARDPAPSSEPPPSHRRESTTTRVRPRCAVAASSACPPRARTSARGSTAFACALALHMELEVEETGRFGVETDLKIARDGRNLAVRGFARLADPERLHASASSRRSRSAAGWARAPPPTWPA